MQLNFATYLEYLGAPPVRAVSDVYTIEQFIDISLFVIRFNYSNTRSLELANSIQKEGKLQNIATVFNEVKSIGDMGVYMGMGTMKRIRRSLVYLKSVIRINFFTVNISFPVNPSPFIVIKDVLLFLFL